MNVEDQNVGDSVKEPVAESPMKITGFHDIPPVERRVFTFSRDGKTYQVEYAPLNYQQVEEIRAAMLPPKPPMRRLGGLEKLSTKELAQRALMGLPVQEPDESDPKYRMEMVKYNNDVKLEQVRGALGWDVPKEEFLALIRQRFTPGELQGLMDEIDSAAWNVNSALVDRFLTSLNPLTDTDESSENSANS